MVFAWNLECIYGNLILLSQMSHFVCDTLSLYLSNINLVYRKVRLGENRKDFLSLCFFVLVIYLYYFHPKKSKIDVWQSLILKVLLNIWYSSYCQTASFATKTKYKVYSNNDDRKLLSFALTAVNILNKLTAVCAKLNSSLSLLFWIHFSI